MKDLLCFHCNRCGYYMSMSNCEGLNSEKELHVQRKSVKKAIDEGQYGRKVRKRYKGCPFLLYENDELYICPSCGYFTFGSAWYLKRSINRPSGRFHFLRKLTPRLTDRPGRLLRRVYPQNCNHCGNPMIRYKDRNDIVIKPICRVCGQKGEFKLEELYMGQIYERTIEKCND